MSESPLARYLARCELSAGVEADCRHPRRAKREQLAGFQEQLTCVKELTNGSSQSHNLALTALCVPKLSDTGNIQGYLAHKKQPAPLGPPQFPRYSPTVGSWEGGGSYKQGTPVPGTWRIVRGSRS